MSEILFGTNQRETSLPEMARREFFANILRIAAGSSVRLSLKSGTDLDLLSGFLDAVGSWTTPISAALAEQSATWIERVPYWFPYSPEAAGIGRRRQNLVPYVLPSLHEVGGPLHKYDIIHRKLVEAEKIPDLPDHILAIDGITNATDIENRYVGAYLRDNPAAASWSGYCRQLAIIGKLEQRPSDDNMPEADGLDLSFIDKVGLLIAKHISDPYVFVSNDRDSIRGVLSRSSGDMVIDAPDQGVVGRWFRAVIGASGNGSSVLATNFGYGLKEIPLNQINQVQVIAHFERIYGTVLLNDSYDSSIYDRARRGRINPHINERVINYIVYGTQIT